MRDLRSSGKYIPIRPSLFNRSIGQEVCDTEYPSWLVAIVVVAVDEDEDGIIIKDVVHPPAMAAAAASLPWGMWMVLSENAWGWCMREEDEDTEELNP